MHDSCRDRFKVVKRQLREAVLRGQDLALLCDLDPPLKGSAGLGQDGLVGGSATAADRAPSSMEQSQGNPLAAGKRLKSDLGLMDLPVAGEESGILVAVGVAQHQFLQGLTLAPHRGKQVAIELGLEQALHDRRSPLEILNRFKQRHHQQGRGAGERVRQAGLLGQQHHLQQIGGGVAHRNHIGVTDARAELLLQAMQHAEDSKRLSRGLRPFMRCWDERSAGLQLLQ